MNSRPFSAFPAARDGTGVIANRLDEALCEWLTLALESPLIAVDLHGVDTAHPSLVGVELDIGAIGSVAADDRGADGGARHIDGDALDEMGARGMLRRCGSCGGPGSCARM